MDDNKPVRGDADIIKPGADPQNVDPVSRNQHGNNNRRDGKFRRGRGGRTQENNGRQSAERQSAGPDQKLPSEQNGQKRQDKPAKQGDVQRGENRRAEIPSAQNQPRPQQKKRDGAGREYPAEGKTAQNKPAAVQNSQDRNVQVKSAAQNNGDNRTGGNNGRRAERGRRSDRAYTERSKEGAEPPNVIDDSSVYLPEYMLSDSGAARQAPVSEPEPEPDFAPGAYNFPDDTAQIVFGDAPVERTDAQPPAEPAETAETAETVEIVDVRFKLSGKTYFFSPNGLTLAKDQNVIVETARGIEFGTVVQSNRMVPLRDIVPPLKNVLRIATDEDKAHRLANEEKEINAFNICLEKIEAHKLDMKLVDAEYTFDNSKLLFYFSSDGRVDFRELARDLASVFRTRIELRQIGIRDEAKMMGGLGICGRPLCCSTFLSDFGQVSIKMAKEQSLSLNSAKISGTCGRLMCCLRYEYGTYAEEIAKTPRVDSQVETPDGPGVVTEISPLAGLVKVRLQKDPDQPPRLYHRSDLKSLGGAKRLPESDGDGVSVGSGSEAESGGDTPAIDPELKKLEDD